MVVQETTGGKEEMTGTFKVPKSLNFKCVTENTTFYLSTFITEIPVNVVYFFFFAGFVVFLNQRSALSEDFWST